MKVDVFIPHLLDAVAKYGGYKQAARKLGIDSQSLTNYIDGTTKELRGKNKRALCEKFGLPLDSRTEVLPSPPPPIHHRDSVTMLMEQIAKRLDEHIDRLQSVSNAIIVQQSHIDRLEHTLNDINTRLILAASSGDIHSEG